MMATLTTDTARRITSSTACNGHCRHDVAPCSEHVIKPMFVSHLFQCCNSVAPISDAAGGAPVPDDPDCCPALLPCCCELCAMLSHTAFNSGCVTSPAHVMSITGRRTYVCVCVHVKDHTDDHDVSDARRGKHTYLKSPFLLQLMHMP